MHVPYSSTSGGRIIMDAKVPIARKTRLTEGAGRFTLGLVESLQRVAALTPSTTKEPACRLVFLCPNFTFLPGCFLLIFAGAYLGLKHLKPYFVRPEVSQRIFC